MTTPTSPADVRAAFAAHLDVIAGELYSMSLLWHEAGLPGDFLGDLYPFGQDLDELQAEVAGAAEALQDLAQAG